MQVTAWSNGNGIYGIRVGRANRERFFQPSWQEIEVDIAGGVCINFDSREDFGETALNSETHARFLSKHGFGENSFFPGR